MKTYKIKQAKNGDGSDNTDGPFERVEAVSPRAARRQFRKRHGLHPTHELICE